MWLFDMNTDTLLKLSPLPSYGCSGRDPVQHDMNYSPLLAHPALHKTRDRGLRLTRWTRQQTQLSHHATGRGVFSQTVIQDPRIHVALYPGCGRLLSYRTWLFNYHFTPYFGQERPSLRKYTNGDELTKLKRHYSIFNNYNIEIWIIIRQCFHEYVTRNWSICRYGTTLVILTPSL